ncbi:MAG: YchJ family protein [Oceanospirillales bacterium]|uniref:YchJ family protein n=1 Tax=Marinobacter maritimus TaxID=277961 RepID=UPI00119F385D|nr:YchJ family protein [Marinobacter maritimus]MBL1271973.1 YchJ family protein [Oceanospirillales bacterium]
MSENTTIPHCPCGSQRRYAECCQRYHAGENAPTPEALMRSRFTAFVLKLEDYLRASWHDSTRPTALDLHHSPDWASLRILDSDENGNTGHVHFQAIYRLNPGWGYLQERSHFVRENGRWYYLEGQPHEGVLKPGRNEPCPCGCGRKFKACEGPK